MGVFSRIEPRDYSATARRGERNRDTVLRAIHRAGAFLPQSASKFVARRRAIPLRLPRRTFSEGKFRMSDIAERTLSKVPEVTLAFWIIKIAATTLGETGGDTVTMTLLHADKDAHNGGYLIGTAIFVTLLIVLVAAQILTKKFHPFLYWATIVASTTFGTTMADFADRSLGFGYTGGSTLLFLCLISVL